MPSKKQILTTFVLASSFLSFYQPPENIPNHRKIVFSKPSSESIAKWSGTATLEEITIFKNAAYNGKAERHVTVTFRDALPTLYREEEDTTGLGFTDDKGTGSHTFHAEITDILNKLCVTDCNTSGPAELHSVVINENDYEIDIISPPCTGTICSPTGGVQAFGPDITSITVSNEPLTNINVLTGTKSITQELPSNYGTITKTITWHLVRSKSEDELIVTPDNYDNWLPEPGKDESTKGSIMKISMKVFGINGHPPKHQAKSFELRLSNTSYEPGICLNIPLVAGKPLADLRFFPQPNTTTVGDFQKATVKCNNGITGETSLAAYDGGGFTTLTVEAIMDDDSKLEGHLLISGGKTEIPVPKRPPSSNIGEAWLLKYHNPLDADDQETSAGNNHNGDGLSAYEEYRGVTTEGNYKRLDPDEKELGVQATPADLALFSEGMNWLENAGSIKIIRFLPNEIGLDRQLNKNNNTSHVYDQNVLKLKKGPLPGYILGKAYPDPGIPVNMTQIVVDYNKIASRQRKLELQAIKENVTLPFNVDELVNKAVAHELSHGVNVFHHGQGELLEIDRLVPKEETGTHIYDVHGTEIIKPKKMEGTVGLKNNQESGDIFCIMNYNPAFDWALHGQTGNFHFYLVPFIPVSSLLCNSGDGTDINKKDANGNNNYFGDAVLGNCLGQIKFKN